MTISAEREALASYPELARLADLRAAGWLFMPVDEDGELVELRGVKLWPSGWVDTMALRDVDEAAALRCDPDGCPSWRCGGTLIDIVEALFALPVPRPWS